MKMISCKMGPKFPAWLQTQRSLQSLYISNSGIVDAAPSWLWKWASQIPHVLHLSDNQISGDLSEVLLNNTQVDLSSNCFTGQLPHLSQNVIELRIANNPFPRRISSFLCRKVNGGSKLEVLNLSNNSLSGKLSNCLMYWPSLTHLNLGDNNLSGKIPNSVGSLFALKALHLYTNSFVRDIPVSLQNCAFLGLVDLAENKFSGNIPSWIGEMSTLMALSLRSNKFIGNIPPQICQLSSLIVLDLANNTLSGAIPKCINNFSTMARMDTAVDDNFKVLFDYNYLKYEDLSLVVKGRKSEYDSILGLVRTIDFSSNNLSGSIPTEISCLSGLRFLNLSQNHLIGRIPEKVGSMETLESLDLSRNHLSGAIPESMTNLSFLDHLDLSYNNLSRTIPSSSQLQSFDALSFIGNDELCGAPLTKNCTKKEDFQGVNHIEESREDFELPWFYIGMATGFIRAFGESVGLFYSKGHGGMLISEDTIWLEMFKGLQPREKGGNGRWWIVIKRLEENIPGGLPS
ncbi:Receptor like protein 42 [Vitis vinifera]|uniref:Receptor like protein 42 n=1 Tax=Vitis vinifera TaxID=29760 RepID=A0A438BRE1_VITVI|nr:Receptor like protein 42 [Vitis vinifera]